MCLAFCLPRGILEPGPGVEQGWAPEVCPPHLSCHLPPQGFVVAILYCFLNGEVQAELRRKWRRWYLHGGLDSDPKYQHPSGGSNGATCSTQVSMLTRVSPGARRSSSFQAEVSLV